MKKKPDVKKAFFVLMPWLDYSIDHLEECKEVVKAQFTKEGEAIQQDASVQLQPVRMFYRDVY